MASTRREVHRELKFSTEPANSPRQRTVNFSSEGTGLLNGGQVASEPYNDDGKFRSEKAARFATPRDEYNKVYYSFVLLGAGFLFPWNAVLNSGPFFSERLGNAKFPFLSSIVYMVPNLLGLIIVVLYGARVSFTKRIVPGFLFFTVLVAAMPFLRVTWAALLCVGLLGLGDAIVQGSIYGLAGQFHPRFVGAVMIGNGVSGIACSGAYIIILFATSGASNSGDLAAIVFFGMSGAVLLGCCVAFVGIINRSPVTKYYLAQSSDTIKEFVTGGLDTSVMAPVTIWGTFKQIWVEAVLVGFNFFVTLALFPGLTVTVPSTHAALNPCPTGAAAVVGSGSGSMSLGLASSAADGCGTFPVPFAVWMIFTFCLGDLIGRSLPYFDALVPSRPVVYVITMLRIVFFPLFILLIHPRLFNNDAISFLIEFAFAVTNGWMGTCLMMYGSSRCEANARELAGTIMVFCLTFGLSAGVNSGLLVDDIITG